MSIFDSLGVAGSGVTVHRKWLDAVSDNLANLNTARPTSEEAFRARYVVAQAVDYGSGKGGAVVGGIELGNAEGRVVHAPDHPLADEDGNVRMPDIDMGAQMTSLLMAQRGYQANLAVVSRAQEAYSAALQLGR
ncbi:MAG: flagellar basal-body rod protein FlgC [Actinomycetota bacterium]|nr:flagellar basal-body rod protein FlgC [Actinomycetota bacterium]